MSTDGRQINKSAIRNFAIEARNILIRSAITEAGFYGITKEEIKSPIQRGRDFEVYETLTGAEKRIFDSDVKRRAALVEAIQQKGFDEVMEETAYTWFNRLIAIRFMEVNNYLPFRMRVLSSDSGSMTPDIVNRSLEVNLNLTEKELTDIQTAKDENNYDEAFRLLFIKTCNELNDILPGLFERTDDYMELLLKLPYTSDGVVRMLVDTIPESNFNVNEGGQVEIIGWLYQYYNTEPKAKAFAKKGKITKEEIPAVTQLFTPDWIVRYMVENSLGRLWVEHLLANGDNRSEQEIANNFGWKYYLPEAEQEPEVQAQLLRIRENRKKLTPEDILCIDPCQGSGHILVYLFEVLMQIYREDGYSERDAARCILEHNLYGLDIDDRAYQLSYFAVLMKARQYDRMILKKHIQPHVFSIRESNSINRNQLMYFGADMSAIERNNAVNQLTGLLNIFQDAKEYGSILNINRYDWNLLRCFVENDRVEGQMDFEAYGIDLTQKQLRTLIDIGEALGQKYQVVVTNPPYIGNMPAEMNKYVLKHYSVEKYDLYSIFMSRCLSFGKSNAYIGMITQHTWMFLSSFEKFREQILKNDVINMIHLGARAFDEISGEVVQTVAFIFSRSDTSQYKGSYVDLTKGTSELEKERNFHIAKCISKPKNEFSLIPGTVIAYWVPLNVLTLFTGKLMKDFSVIKSGIVTGNNDYFLKLWYEIDIHKIGFDHHEFTDNSNVKWVPMHKGGGYRKHYGLHEYIMNLHDIWDPSKTNESVRKGEPRYYFKQGLTWSTLSNSLSVRKSPSGFVFDTKGSMCFISDVSMLDYFEAFLNSKVASYFMSFLSPTLDFNQGAMSKIPVILCENQKEEIIRLAEENVDICKSEWDSHETSWDFNCNNLIPDLKGGSSLIKKYYDILFTERENMVHSLKQNEELINSIFIKAYGLADQLDNSENIDSMSIKLVDKRTAIIELISYAIGCMFGRYSLDFEGLTYAGGDWKKVYSTKYWTFMPDEDAIIPITDEEYFEDDIVARFVDFIRIVYGGETLELNLKFIADAIGNKGDSPRAVIRNYFLNDFYKDHCKTYSATGSGKRPIYWLFDSGKQNGFKALIYIHRYTPDTVGLIRSVYLHNAQSAIQNSLKNSEYIISTTTSATERARETKKKDKYIRQLNELRPYYQALSHIALQRIPMDLDNGVKKNYQLFQGVEISTEGKKKQKINLLAKI